MMITIMEAEINDHPLAREEEEEEAAEDQQRGGDGRLAEKEKKTMLVDDPPCSWWPRRALVHPLPLCCGGGVDLHYLFCTGGCRRAHSLVLRASWSCSRCRRCSSLPLTGRRPRISCSSSRSCRCCSATAAPADERRR